MMMAARRQLRMNELALYINEEEKTTKEKQKRRKERKRFLTFFNVTPR
jgi:hypothetical protein